MKKIIWLWLILVFLFPPMILRAQTKNDAEAQLAALMDRLAKGQAAKKPGGRVPVRPSGQTEKVLKFGSKDQSPVQPTAEMRLPQPTRFALIRDRETGQVNLQKPDDPIFVGRDPLPIGRIVRLDDSSLVFAPLSGQLTEVRKGSNLPASRRLIFLGSVVLERFRFQVRFGGSSAAPAGDYSVVEIADRQATLQRDALPGESQNAAAGSAVPQLPFQAPIGTSARSGSATRTQDAALANLVNSIPIREVGQNTWEVSTQEVREASSTLSQLFFEALSSARPSLTPWYGLAVTVDTSAGAGTLDRRGFLIQDPKLASRMGLETGDRILFVNQQPVNSVGGLYRIYTNLRSDSDVSEVKVLVNRENVVRTLTYRLR